VYCGRCCGTAWSTARAAIAEAMQRGADAKFNLAMRKKLATISQKYNSRGPTPHPQHPTAATTNNSVNRHAI